jgi:hypothetical protein
MQETFPKLHGKLFHNYLEISGQNFQAVSETIPSSFGNCS